MKSRKMEHMLFMLGHFLSETNKGFGNSPLAISVSKVNFIEVIEKLGVVGKKERAVYKNLEQLEKDRFILYKNKNLGLTKKGYSRFLRLKDKVQPYFDIQGKIAKDNILKTATKAQTVLRL